MNISDFNAECQRAQSFAREEVAGGETSPEFLALSMLDKGFDLTALAYGFALEAARGAMRGAVRTTERSSVTSTPPTDASGRPISKRQAEREFREEQDRKFYSSPEGKAELARQAAEERAAKARWDGIMQQIQDDIHDKATALADQMVAEWTADLLASTFALPDGKRVTWGEATADQHRIRVNMLVKQAAGTTETAALHQKALQEMGQARVSRLADLAGAAA